MEKLPYGHSIQSLLECMDDKSYNHEVLVPKFYVEQGRKQFTVDAKTWAWDEKAFLLWLMEPSRFIFTFSLYCLPLKAPRKFNKSEITDKLESLFAIIITLIKLLWQPT